MHRYDKSSKWLIRRYGGVILRRLLGIRRIASWKALQAETVAPRRLPDGIIEVRRVGKPRPALFVLEISTYPYKRLARQALDDALLIYLERGIVPEVVSIVLRPRGQRPVPGELTVLSEEGTTQIRVQWKVVEVWKIPAEELLTAGDVGLIPLVPLARFDGPVEPILQECRERIDRIPSETECENLRVVTHFFAGLEYNDPRLFEKLGGNNAMFKTGSPILREIVEEETRKAAREAKRQMAETAITSVLTARFGPEAEALRTRLKAIGDTRFEEFFGLAGTCPDLASFREQIPSRRRKRKD
jgi:hypothetical protein